MSTTDAISIFAEGTFEEQIKELVNYLARDLPEEEKAAYAQPFIDSFTTAEGQTPIEEDEARRRQVITLVLKDVKGFGNGSDREIEGFFNLLLAHFLTLFPLDAPETKEQLSSLLQTITSSEGEPSVKYHILSNLFNAIPRHSELRLEVNQALIQIASANDDLEQVHLSETEVERWLSEWQITPEQKSAYLKALVDVYAQANNLDASYKYQIAYVKSLPLSSAEGPTLDLIATALRSPDVFDYDTLFRLEAISSAKDSPLLDLLKIFLNDGLAEYKAWQQSNEEVNAKFDLDRTQLERKIRLLSLTTLAFQNIGRDLTYTVIADLLQVESSQVERWIIDVIRAGLVSGKLSQTSRTFHVVRASARAFERQQWESLEKRLAAWKIGLAGVLDVVIATKKKGSPEAATPAVKGTDTPAQQPQAAAV